MTVPPNGGPSPAASMPDDQPVNLNGEASLHPPPQIDFSTLPVEDVPLELLHATEEGDCNPSPEMVESLNRDGNIQPILLGHHPKITGAFQILTGHHRVAGLRRTSRKTARAMIVPFVVPEDMRLELDMQLNNLQRNVKPIERAAKAMRLMEIHPHLTQKQVARRFGCSASALCRDIVEYSMGDDFKTQTFGLNTAVRQTIMTERDSIKRAEAIVYALMLEPDGSRPSRDRVALYIKQNRDGKPKGRKPAGFTVKDKDGEINIKPRSGITTLELIKWLEAIAAKAKAHQHLPPEGMRYVFGS